MSVTIGNVSLATMDDLSSVQGANDPNMFGGEWLSRLHKRLISGSSVKIIMSGDSTTQGGYNTAPFVPSTLLSSMIVGAGISGVTVINSGVSGKNTSDWVSSYLAADLAQNPDVYIIRWGINDIVQSGTVESFTTNLRSGLATIRANKTLAQMSVVLMTPNSTYRNNLPEGWTDPQWYEAIVPVIRQAALDYQCLFIDTYHLWPDSKNGADYYALDTIGYVHPQDVMQTWIISKLFDVLFPQYYRSGGSSGSSPIVISPTLSGSWVNSGSPSRLAGYYKTSDGVVHITGAVNGGTVGSTIFVLPAGYRPGGEVAYAVMTSAGYGVVAILSNGIVFLFSGGTSIYLDGISFLAEC